MSQPDPDLRIDAWLREELDAVPQPTRALSWTLEIIADTPQRRGRLSWLRQLLGLDRATVYHGSVERPEVVLSPGAGGGTATLGRQGAISLPLVLAALVLVLAVLGAVAWLSVGPGGGILGGTDGTQPMRPIEQSGPSRVIVVDPHEGHFATLAAAVAEAQPGDRIELRPGVHQAEVVIDKDIEIVGAGDRAAVIVEPLPLARDEALTDRLRVLFRLEDTTAVLRGLTLRGSDNGTAVVIDGGRPLLEDLLIDPMGEMITGSPGQPREAIAIGGGASPTVRGSELTSLVGVDAASAPLFEGVSFRRGCLLVDGEGTRPTIRDTEFSHSECPGFSISIAGGARADIAAVSITGAPGNSGIRVANDGSSAAVSGSTIAGGKEGLLVGPGAALTFQRSNAQGAEVGIRVESGELLVLAGAVVDNGIGLQVSGDSFLEVSDTDICNETNFELRDGAEVPTEPNRVCDDSTSEFASRASS